MEEYVFQSLYKTLNVKKITHDDTEDLLKTVDAENSQIKPSIFPPLCIENDNPNNTLSSYINQTFKQQISSKLIEQAKKVSNESNTLENKEKEFIMNTFDDLYDFYQPMISQSTKINDFMQENQLLNKKKQKKMLNKSTKATTKSLRLHLKNTLKAYHETNQLFTNANPENETWKPSNK